MSAPSICRLLREGGMRLSRPQHTITSPDPGYALKKGRSRRPAIGRDFLLRRRVRHQLAPDDPGHVEPDRPAGDDPHPRSADPALRPGRGRLAQRRGRHPHAPAQAAARGGRAPGGASGPTPPLVHLRRLGQRQHPRGRRGRGRAARRRGPAGPVIPKHRSSDLRVASATGAWRGGQRRTAAMPALAIRQDLPAAELRRLARREPDRRAAMRLLAIANALDGFSRAEAARLAGMERQALRDAVLRYNAEGVGSLRDRPRAGRPEGLTPGQQAALKGWVLRGPAPEQDGVSAWRLVDICARAEQAYGVRYSAWGMSRLLKRLGLSRQKTRPQHPEGSAAERAAFEKGARTEARRHRRSPSASAGPALV